MILHKIINPDNIEIGHYGSKLMNHYGNKPFKPKGDGNKIRLKFTTKETFSADFSHYEGNVKVFKVIK